MSTETIEKISFLLKKTYGRFYIFIKQRMQTCATLEIRPSIRQIKIFIPALIASNLFSNLEIDQVESAYSLSFEDGKLANIIMFDIWYHFTFHACRCSPKRGLARFKSGQLYYHI